MIDIFGFFRRNDNKKQPVSKIKTPDKVSTPTPLKIEKPMSKGDLQRLFVKLVADLILFAYDQGYELTFGDAYRDPRVHGKVGEKLGYGHAKSNHKNKLAIDFNLFKDGKYLDKTEDHKELGNYWESLHEKCIWGGRFSDGNHYSFMYRGMK